MMKEILLLRFSLLRVTPAKLTSTTEQHIVKIYAHIHRSMELLHTPLLIDKLLPARARSRVNIITTGKLLVTNE